MQNSVMIKSLFENFCWHKNITLHIFQFNVDAWASTNTYLYFRLKKMIKMFLLQNEQYEILMRFSFNVLELEVTHGSNEAKVD